MPAVRRRVHGSHRIVLDVLDVWAHRQLRAKPSRDSRSRWRRRCRALTGVAAISLLDSDSLTGIGKLTGHIAEPREARCRRILSDLQTLTRSLELP